MPSIVFRIPAHDPVVRQGRIIVNDTDTFAESKCGTEIAWPAGDASVRYVSVTVSCDDQTVTLGAGKHFRCLEGEADLDLPKLDWLINKLTETRAAIAPAAAPQPRLRGIVRDYHSDGQRPYRHVLHDESDTGKHELSRGFGYVHALFSGIADGHAVEVLVRDLGMSEAGQLQRWHLIEPHTYGPVPLQATI